MGGEEGERAKRKHISLELQCEQQRAVKWPSRFASWQKPLYKPQRDKSRSRHSIAELGFQRGDSMIESDRKELEQEIVALGQTVATMLADLQLELCSQGKG
jgi:hypothetical protein